MALLRQPQGNANDVPELTPASSADEFSDGPQICVFIASMVVGESHSFRVLTATTNQNKRAICKDIFAVDIQEKIPRLSKTSTVLFKISDEDGNFVFDSLIRIPDEVNENTGLPYLQDVYLV